MRSRIFTTLLLAFCFAGAPALRAQQPVRPTPEGVQLNFQDADLSFVLYALAQAAGISYTSADIPQKPVTLRTSQPLTQAQIISLIRSIAEANGVTVTDVGGVLRLQGLAGPAQEDPRQLYIHKLRHARAPVLASTLQSLFSFGGPIPRVTTTSPTLTQQLREMAIQNQAAAQAAARQQAMMMQSGMAVPGGVTIVPDEVTNSLLIRATPADWQVMQQAIQALDLRPLQVVIEVVIAEVRRANELNVGVSLSADASRGDRTTTGDLPSNPSDNDFTLRIVRRGDIDIDATLSALSTTGNVRIISRPVVQAQNNQEAMILVGSKRPFVQISRALPNDGTRDEVVQYLDVGTKLTILPTINDDGYVNLAVAQEVSSATNETQFAAPVISTREATTQILARDGQTVVIGGLVDRQTDRTRSGIPLLKDIPILGALFGTTRESSSNSELFLFLTPHIVEGDEEADRLKRELEQNLDLLKPLTPIRPLIPPDTTAAPRGTP